MVVDYHLDKYSILNSGLLPGENLVGSAIVPAIPGMLLEVVPPDDYYEKATVEIGENENA